MGAPKKEMNLPSDFSIKKQATPFKCFYYLDFSVYGLRKRLRRRTRRRRETERRRCRMYQGKGRMYYDRGRGRMNQGRQQKKQKQE